MAREIPVGIDLGTTNSAVAYVDGSGRTEIVRNAEGEMLTPSVVMFGDNEVVVGKDARRANTAQPDLVAEWVKRDMGQPSYSRPINGKFLPPEVIQACVLKKLRTDLDASLGRGAKVVITVPAYFDEPRRKATADAGEMAGLDVLDIVNEPTAAALAFGEALGYLSPTGGPQEEMTLLVYDLGGGTFDATLLRLAPGDVQTMATDGDVQLGGHDWDQRLVDFAAEAFVNTHQIDPRLDPAGLNRLFNAVVEAKHTLTARTRATLRVEHAGKIGEMQITREQFEELTADLVERTAYTIRQLLKVAQLQWSNVDRLLLVGGSTRMPAISAMLEAMTGLKPDHSVNPDEAVARGAALYAAYLLAKQAEGGSGATYRVTNVNAHSLGVEGIDKETLRKTNVILIPRNTGLPAVRTDKFTTKRPGQRSIVVQVLEGESSRPGDCTAIGRMVVRDLPDGLPKGWPVEVTFRYGSNGRLSVRAVVPGTEHEATLDLERFAGLCEEGIARWKNPVGSSAGFDVFESAIDEVLGPSPAAGADAAPALPVKASPASPAPGTAAPQAGTAAPAGSAPLPSGAEPELTAAKTPPTPSTGRRVPTWAINVIGYVVSAVVGLGLGYLVLAKLRPNAFPLPW